MATQEVKEKKADRLKSESDISPLSACTGSYSSGLPSLMSLQDGKEEDVHAKGDCVPDEVQVKSDDVQGKGDCVPDDVQGKGDCVPDD